MACSRCPDDRRRLGRSPLFRHRVILALVPVVALGAISCGGGAASESPSTITASAGSSGQPVSEVLGRIPAPEAPGYEQYLLRVTIPPGVELDARHPSGLEVAYIEDGELFYRVIDGGAGLGHRGDEGPVEQLVGPVDVVLRPGDTVYENRDTNHAAANRGDVPVVLVVASLVEIGQPLAVEN